MTDDFWGWLQDFAPRHFQFLVEEFGFKLLKSEFAIREYYLDYQKGDVRTGLYCSLGARPEVYIRSRGRTLHTGSLISRYAKGWELPVSWKVFHRQTTKEDYTAMLTSYTKLLTVCLNAIDQED